MMKTQQFGNGITITHPDRARAGTRSCGRVWIIKGPTKVLAVRGYAGNYQVRDVKLVIGRLGRMAYEVVEGPSKVSHKKLDQALLFAAGKVA